MRHETGSTFAGPGLHNGVLAMDIGSGTQDILVWTDGVAMENCPKMILPSPTSIVAKQIRKAIHQRQHLFLTGKTMGGGPCTAAIRDHLKAGLRVFASEQAALTFHDNLKKLSSMGIELVQSRPDITPLTELKMGDVDIEALRETFKRFHIPMPSTIAIAVQDHGFSPQASNRAFRFEMWKKALDAGGSLEQMLYSAPPPYLTRMRAVQELVPGAWLMDTGASAILGALLDPWIAQRKAEGIVIVNIGNEHVVAALIKGDRMFGIYEHHTSVVDPPKLKDHLDRFRKGLLTNEEVFQDMGHGCAITPDATQVSAFAHLGITGPNRGQYQLLNGHMAAPFGDMMLTGCFGLIEALRLRKVKEDARH